MSIEDNEAELEQIGTKLEDVNSVISLLASVDSEREVDMRTQFVDMRERLLKTREKTLKQMEAIRMITRH